jgi:hypothetical protein
MKKVSDTKRKLKEEHEEISKLIEGRIQRLFHFTDRKNLESIVECGGLYSLKRQKMFSIPVKRYGGSTDSQSVIRYEDLDKYISLSLINNHPMRGKAISEGRIDECIDFEIDPEVMLWKGTSYCD